MAQIMTGCQMKKGCKKDKNAHKYDKFGFVKNQCVSKYIFNDCH